LNNQDIRARILQDIYVRKQQGLEAGLIKGQSIGEIGSTRKTSFVLDLTSFGFEAVEGRAGRELAVNFSIINITAPVTQSQIAAGTAIEQTQSLDINTLQDLERYLEQRIHGAEIEALKTQLRELDAQMKAGAVKPSTLSKIRETVTSLGPTAAVVIDIIAKLLGLGK